MIPAERKVKAVRASPKKVPAGRHARTAGTPTGKFGAALQFSQGRCAARRENWLSARGLRPPILQWVPPKACRFSTRSEQFPLWGNRSFAAFCLNLLRRPAPSGPQGAREEGAPCRSGGRGLLLSLAAPGPGGVEEDGQHTGDGPAVGPAFPRFPGRRCRSCGRCRGWVFAWLCLHWLGQRTKSALFFTEISWLQ